MRRPLGRRGRIAAAVSAVGLAAIVTSAINPLPAAQNPLLVCGLALSTAGHLINPVMAKLLEWIGAGTLLTAYFVAGEEFSRDGDTWLARAACLGGAIVAVAMIARVHPQRHLLRAGRRQALQNGSDR